MTIQYHSDTLILFLSHSAHSINYQFPANRLFLLIQWCPISSHLIKVTFLWTRLMFTLQRTPPSLHLNNGLPHFVTCCSFGSLLNGQAEVRNLFTIRGLIYIRQQCFKG